MSEHFNDRKKMADARRDWILEMRELGKTYDWISTNLEKYGFPPNLSKVRVGTIIKTYRPDLMGSRAKERQQSQRVRRP